MVRSATIGVDIGGTKTLCLLLDAKSRVLHEIKFKTLPNRGCKRLLDELIRSVRALSKKADQDDLKLIGVGIGCAGKIDAESGTVENSPNILCLEGCELRKVIDRALGFNTVLGNDVHLGLWGEHQVGIAAGHSNVLGVFFGTGVGGAAIIDGRLYEGASGVGGQIGCVLAQPVGGPEAAQSHGIVDRIASKSAVAAEAAQMAAKNWAPYLHKTAGSDLSKIGWRVLAKAIKHGDKRIEEMLRARMQVVGIALSSVVNFLNPELLVLGGGLMDELPRLVANELEDGLRKHLTPEVSGALEVKRAKLRGQAVAVGAGLLAFKKLG